MRGMMSLVIFMGVAIFVALGFVVYGVSKQSSLKVAPAIAQEIILPKDSKIKQIITTEDEFIFLLSTPAHKEALHIFNRQDGELKGISSIKYE